MAITNGYCAVADVTGESVLGLSGDPSHDTAIETAIEAASRMIDQECKRRFYVDVDATARVYAAIADGCVVHVDDISTTDDLVIKVDEDCDGTFETTWTSAMYQLEPLNGRAESGEAWPYMTIRPRAGYRFPVSRGDALVQVTAKWGWPGGPPAPVKNACVIQTVAGFKAPTAPFGIAGGADFGALRISRHLHPSAAALLAGYVRTIVGV